MKSTFFFLFFTLVTPLLAQDSLLIQYIDLHHDKNSSFSRKEAGLNTFIFEGIKSHELKPIKFDLENPQRFDSLSYKGWEESISTDIGVNESDIIRVNTFGPTDNHERKIETYRPIDISSIVIDTRKSSNGINTIYIHYYFPGRHYDNITGVNIYTFSLNWNEVISYLKANQNTYLFYKNTYKSWWKGGVLLSVPQFYYSITFDLASLNNKGKFIFKNYHNGKPANIESALKQTTNGESILVYRKNNQIKKIAFDFDGPDCGKPHSDHIILSANWNDLKTIMEHESIKKPMIKPMYRALLDNDFYADSTTSISSNYLQEKEVTPNKLSNQLYSYSETGSIYFNLKNSKKNNKSFTTLFSFINKQILTGKLPVYSTKKIEQKIPVDEFKKISYFKKWAYMEYDIVESIDTDDGWGNSREVKKPVEEEKPWTKETYWEENNYNLFRLDTIPIPSIEVNNKIIFNNQGVVRSILVTNLTILLPYNHPDNLYGYSPPLFRVKWEDLSVLMKKSKDNKVRRLYKDLVNSNFTKELYWATPPVVYEK